MNNIDIKSWEPYKMNDIFKFTKGKRLVKNDMIPGKLNYLGAISDNNAVRDSINASAQHMGNCITVNYNGSVGEAFYQSEPFWATDDINILDLKNYEMNENIGLFLCTIIKQNKYKFSYGRKWTLEQMKNTIILLPSTNGRPDYEYMDLFIDNLGIKHIKTNNSCPSEKIELNNWKEYLISDLFEVKGTKTTKIEELETYGSGIYPYVTTQSSNNGVAGNYDFFTEKGNVLTIDSAVVGYCSYQEKNFSASDHVEKLIPKFKLNKYIALFIVAIINQENYRYSYGRKFNQTQIKNTKISLPSMDGKPDWVYIENYIKGLPYADKL